MEVGLTPLNSVAVRIGPVLVICLIGFGIFPAGGRYGRLTRTLRLRVRDGEPEFAGCSAEVIRSVEDADDRRPRPEPPRVGREPLCRSRGPRRLQGARVVAFGADHCPGAGRNLDHVEGPGRPGAVSDGDAVEVGQLRALGGEHGERIAKPIERRARISAASP